MILALAMLAAGCSGSGGGTPAAPAAGAPAGTAPPAHIAWERAPKLEVVLDDYSFTPAQVVLRANQPYVLRLRNASGARHTFTAPEFFRTIALGPGDASTQVRAGSGSVSVAPGEAASLDVLPLRPGSYPLTCDRPLHSLFGMTGEIVVQ
ncbi:MAG: cupredoxin domain-containing protein [Rhodospirillales bacterium]